MSDGPLERVRILDLSSVVMGPYGTQALGDLGAEVIVVEGKHGDINRAMGPGPVTGLSGVALNLMRNKRSIGLDLKNAAGRQTFLDIAATCDVVVTNLRPAPLSRLGLTYNDVVKVRPDIIFCQAHGFSSDSDQANAPAYDDIIQAASGVADLFSLQGHEPSLMPTLIADKVAGMTITSSVLAALYHRAMTGTGQFIEVPMLDVIKAFLLVEHGSSAIHEPPTAPPGHARILTPWRKPQQTLDGWIHVLPYTANHYRYLFTAAGRADLCADESRFVSRAARFSNSDSLYRDIAGAMLSKSTHDWLALCDEQAIPVTAVGTLNDLVNELPVVEHPVAGKYRQIPPAVTFSKTPASIRSPAPLPGQDSRKVLLDIGYQPEQIAQLLSSGVVIQPRSTPAV